ncbi:MAG: GNAT family N-acetyltransferase [Sphingomonas sp.]
MSLPVLQTERLTLRPLGGEDFEAWAAFHADPEAMRFLGGVQPRSVAWRGLCAMAGAWMVRGFSMFTVIERDSGRWVGRVGPHQPEGWPGTEIGWGIARDFEGRGYAREAAAAGDGLCRRRARLGRHHPHHRSRQPAFDPAGGTAGIGEPRPDPAAAAGRRLHRRRLGPERRRMARARRAKAA